RKASHPDSVVVLEAAVALEAGWNDFTDELWVVIAEPEIAIERAMKRDGLTREAVEQRLASQWKNAERTAKADVVIENNGSLADLLTAVDAAWG
ncbi:MAG: dephospho-CoA kinase, partial [Pseudomonadales bacterium]